MSVNKIHWLGGGGEWNINSMSGNSWGAPCKLYYQLALRFLHVCHPPHLGWTEIHSSQRRNWQLLLLLHNLAWKWTRKIKPIIIKHLQYWFENMSFCILNIFVLKLCNSHNSQLYISIVTLLSRFYNLHCLAKGYFHLFPHIFMYANPSFYDSLLIYRATEHLNKSLTLVSNSFLWGTRLDWGYNSKMQFNA